MVVFNGLTSIPGQTSMYTEVRAGSMRISNGTQFNLPIPYFNPETRTFWIEGREYPMERVHYWERAKTAFIKPEPLANHDYTAGKRAKRS